MGEKIAKKIDELLETGKLAKLEKVMKKGRGGEGVGEGGGEGVGEGGGGGEGVWEGRGWGTGQLYYNLFIHLDT